MSEFYMVDCHLWTAGTCFLGFSLESAEQMASGGWTVTWDLPHEAGGTWDLADWRLCWKSKSGMSHSPQWPLLLIYPGGNFLQGILG